MSELEYLLLSLHISPLTVLNLPLSSPYLTAYEDVCILPVREYSFIAGSRERKTGRCCQCFIAAILPASSALAGFLWTCQPVVPWVEYVSQRHTERLEASIRPIPLCLGREASKDTREQRKIIY